MGCDCGKPKCDGHCGVSPAVLQINNPSECVLFHRVEVPASMGDSKTNPPKSGAYKNVLLFYEADQTSWLYSSDGVPQKLVNGLTDYEDAINLPQINGVTLIGDKNSADLKLADAPMVITIASGNTTWSGADTAEDIYNFFLNQGKVNVIFEGSENYGYEIVSAAYIPGEQKMMCMTTVASLDAGSSPVEFTGSALYGLMTFYTVDKAVDVGELDLQSKLFITDFTGLELNDNVLSGVPATGSSIGMVKPGDGLSVSSDGTLTVIDHVFDTVADMKLATNLVDGSYAQTLGFHSVNDGGGALYKISDTGTANEMDVIAVGSVYASIVANDEINIKQLGAYGDDTHDVYDVLNYGINNFKSVTIPSGTYLIETAINLEDSVELKGIGNPVIHVNTGGHGFIADNINDIKVTAIEFTAPEDNTAQATHAGHHIFKFTGCKYITIDNCKAYYGVMGFTFKDCSDITFTNNIMHHFTGWSNVFGYDLSNCDNALIEGNTSYNGSYDGIKLTGYISNIQIINNTCYDNASDGIDYAGQCAKNVVVSGNNLSNSTLNGIDFKQLDRDTYPFDETKEKFFENITISLNNINNVVLHGINSQLYYDDVSIQSFVICNNNVNMKKVLLPSGGSGIRVAPCVATLKHAVVIRDNTITASSPDTYDFGIRISDATNILIKNNSVVGTFNNALYIDKQVGTCSDIDIISNILINSRSASNTVVGGTATVTNIKLEDNILQNNYSGYLIDSNIAGTTGLSLVNNKTLDTFTALPTVRVTKNIIFPSADPTTAGCMGWICNANGMGSSSNMKQYITIA